jgi:type 1 fimbria pilin
MKLRTLKFAVPALLLIAIFAAGDPGQSMTIKGYVLDSACAFTKGLKKPISAECAIACAKAGSPLVILTTSGTIYWPIADTTPSSSQNDKLLQYAGTEVTVSGKVFVRGGSTAIVISKVEPLAEKK